MHDITFIRKNPEIFDNAMRRRGLEGQAEAILEADKSKRGGQADMQALQQRSNELAKQIGQLMGQGKRDEAAPLMEESKQIKAKISDAKAAEEGTLEGGYGVDAVTSILETLPNIMADDVPDGNDEDDNVELRKWGKPKTAVEFGFEPKEHFDLGENLKDNSSSLLNFESSAKISGSRFSILKGQLAYLERALGNFMLDINTQEFGYNEVSPPLLVRDSAMYGTGQLPKFTEDSFKTENDYWLIPTAEVSLTNMVAGEILDSESLPLRFVARTPCFRSEAGSAGKDTRGLIRQHQFYKVEMVSITNAESSVDEHERKTKCAETILQKLNLPYRVMVLCSGDTGFGATKTYDLEVWLPGQNTYREISSCSNCGDFQGRRMNARYRARGEKQTNFVHTLNGSGLAVGRTLVAVLENYQQEDGSIRVPEILLPYMNGLKVIKSEVS